MQFNRSKDLAETMISEIHTPNSQWIQQVQSPSVIPIESNPIQKNINCNVSVSTGEEFSMEFLQDRSASRVAPAIIKDHGNIEQKVDLHNQGNHGNHGNKSHQQGYEDLSSVLGLRRMDSECGSDGTDYASARGSTDNGVYDNNGMRKTTKVISHDQSSLSSTAPHFTESEIAHSSQTDGSQSKKIKFLCSFGGKILSRPSDGKLRYVGGDTRMISISKNISFEELVKKTSESCNQPHTIKYQLPDEDLDALISVSSDEDLQNMIEEYYSIEKRGGSQRLRIFLVPLIESENSFSINPSSIPHIPQGDPDYQYFVAVNGGSGVESKVSETIPLSGVNILNPTPLTNGPVDLIMPVKQTVPISPIIMHETDRKNDHTRLQKEKSSCTSFESPNSFTTAKLEPEVSRNNVQVPQVPIDFLKLHDDTNQKRELKESVPQVPELNVSNFQDFGKSIVEGRTFRSETPFLGSNDMVGLFPEMPHAFSDSKLNEYGGDTSNNCSQDGINSSFSWNLAPVSADLQEKRAPQHENVEIFNPNFLDVEKVVSNQGVDFINFPSETVSAKKIDSPEIFNILPNFQPNNQKQNIHASVELMMENNQENCTKNVEKEANLDQSIRKTRDSNCLIDLVSEFSNGFVSNESSNQQSSAVINNTPQIHNAQNQNQNTALRREYSLLDDDFISNVDQNVPKWAHNNEAESFPLTVTVHRQVDTVQTEYPSPSATQAENTPQDLASEDENFNEESKNSSITEAMMAEMEADVYGLQIIKNADLEELKELGSGTYGTVYHGRWRGTDVAIKRIRKACFSGRSSEQERLIQDFWKEARILSNLHHPNVVAFYGVVPDGAGGTMATVTEFMANGSLRSVLLKKDRLLDRRRKLIIAMDAAFGMEYLHGKNIIHFDLKCDNLLVNLRDPQRPVCKVGDFGLSKIKRNTLVSGGVRGTLPWMAPELLNGGSNLVSDKVDVFSFGIVMWEILTGDEPYANMHCGAIIGGIVKNTLRPAVPEGCDLEWKKLMEQCWSNFPEQRPSFTEITNRLRSMSAALQNTKGPTKQMPNISA